MRVKAADTRRNFSRRSRRRARPAQAPWVGATCLNSPPRRLPPPIHIDKHVPCCSILGAWGARFLGHVQAWASGQPCNETIPYVTGLLEYYLGLRNACRAWNISNMLRVPAHSRSC